MSLNTTIDAFERIWARVSPWLEEALDRSGCTDTIDDVKQAVLNGSCQLYHHERGAGITLIDKHEKVPTLRLWLAGGEMEALAEMLPAAEEYARRMGCTRLVLLGRTGWQRSFLTNVGFKPCAVEMEKTLSLVEVSNG